MDQQQRIEAIYLASVEKMKEVVREFGITQDELHIAGDYFARLGQSGMFRSLLDVSLAMTAVEVAGGGEYGTRPNLEGPYFAQHRERADGVMFDGEAPAGMPRLTVTGRVTDARTGEPMPDAELDMWHADSNGIYDRQGDHLRGRIKPDADGRYRIETVLPNDYSEHDHDPLGELFRVMGRHNTRAAHIHVKAKVDGRVVLTTQVFMSTSTFLDKDYVEGAVSDDLTADLVKDADGNYSATFDFALDRMAPVA